MAANSFYPTLLPKGSVSQMFDFPTVAEMIRCEHDLTVPAFFINIVSLFLLYNVILVNNTYYKKGFTSCI